MSIRYKTIACGALFFGLVSGCGLPRVNQPGCRVTTVLSPNKIEVSYTGKDGAIRKEVLTIAGVRGAEEGSNEFSLGREATEEILLNRAVKVYFAIDPEYQLGSQPVVPRSRDTVYLLDGRKVLNEILIDHEHIRGVPVSEEVGFEKAANAINRAVQRERFPTKSSTDSAEAKGQKTPP